MYAVVEIQGSQFKVSKNQKLYVNRLKGNEGTKVSFDNVLLVDDDGKVKVGMPNVSGAIVEAKILSHQNDVHLFPEHAIQKIPISYLRDLMTLFPDSFLSPAIY